jgi:hypothetical protein
MGNYCAVVPGGVYLSFSLKIDSDSIVTVAGTSDVGSSQANADVLKSFAAVQAGIEIPFLAPVLSDSIVELDSKEISFEFAVKRAAFGEVEPELKFVTDFGYTLVLRNASLNVDGAASSFCCNLEDCKLFMNEVVVNEGIG